MTPGVRRRPVAAALLALLVALLVTGCAAITAALDAEDALEEAGHREATVTWSSTNGYVTVDVTWRAAAETSDGLREESLAVAGVLWRSLAVRIDAVFTDPFGELAGDVGTASRDFSRNHLELEFGPRPPGLDRSASEVFNVRGIVIGVVVAFVIGLALTALIVVLLVRHGRAKRVATAAGPWGAPPPGAWGAPPRQWPPPPAWPGSPPPAPPAAGSGGPAFPPTLAAPGATPDDPWRPPAQ